MTGRKGHGSVLMEEYMVQFPELKTKYIDNMRPLFSRYALYSDETENFRIPAEPEPGQTVTIRFRTLKGNVDDVYLISGSTRQHMTLLTITPRISRWAGRRCFIILRYAQERSDAIITSWG